MKMSHFIQQVGEMALEEKDLNLERYMHGCDRVTLLVGRVYECVNNLKHEVFAHHPEVV